MSKKIQSPAQQSQEDPKAMFNLPEVDQAADAPRPIERIHACECVQNSECTFTDGCRGRLKYTAAVNGQVQVYCLKCHVFAEGTRPLSGSVSSGDRKLFDRVKGQAVR